MVRIVGRDQGSSCSRSKGAVLYEQDHRGFAQGLHGGQLSDNSIAFGHALHADSQDNGDNSGKSLPVWLKPPELPAIMKISIIGILSPSRWRK